MSADLTTLAREELQSLRDQAERELERRRLEEVGRRPANIAAADVDLDYLDTRWAREYMGDLMPDDESRAAIQWLWAMTVIGHEAQVDRLPSVDFVARRICDAIAPLAFGGEADATMFDEVGVRS